MSKSQNTGAISSHFSWKLRWVAPQLWDQEYRKLPILWISQGFAITLTTRGEFYILGKLKPPRLPRLFAPP